MKVFLGSIYGDKSEGNIEDEMAQQLLSWIKLVQAAKGPWSM
jgi:hypothetical protein